MKLQLIGLKKKNTTSNKEVICHHKFIHVRCSAHILNIIVHEGLKDDNDSIIKIRKMVKCVKSSPPPPPKKIGPRDGLEGGPTGAMVPPQIQGNKIDCNFFFLPVPAPSLFKKRDQSAPHIS
jgi:hypothetical protein